MGNSNWGSMGNSNRGRAIGRSSRVGHIRDKAIVVISLVVDGLDAAIRKIDRVRSLDIASSIIGLSLVEGSTRVVISNSIVVAVGRHLSKVRGSIASSMSNNRGMVGVGSMGNNRGMVGRG